VAYRTGFTLRRTPRLPRAQGFHGFESRHLLDQAEPVAAPTAASSSTTTQGLPPEAMIVNVNIAIRVVPFYPLQGQFRIMDCPMNILTRDKQIDAISALTEGCSIRATERLTSIHRDTIMRLGVRVGEGCAALRFMTR
jgi:hypothetical protein